MKVLVLVSVYFLFCLSSVGQSVCLGINCPDDRNTQDQSIDLEFGDLMMRLALSNLNSGLFEEEDRPSIKACYAACDAEYRQHLDACRAVFTRLNGLVGDSVALGICREQARDSLARCLRPFGECNR